MKSFAVAAALVGAAYAAPQGVTSAISPKSTAPAGCSASHDGVFQIQVVNVTSSAKRSVEKRAALEITLADGILTDSEGRTGYIAANNQFQFDKPAQTGAIYTSGWSLCSNGSLALGSEVTFKQCLSGTFYNLYDDAEMSPQCSPVYIEALTGGSTGGADSVSSAGDGQATAAAGSTMAASQLTDGQVTASAVAPVTQITDGQIQASTGKPVAQITDGQIQASTGAAVTQITDGQIQAATKTPAAAVSQITDGQVQAATGKAVSQITDGQIQAATGTPVTQITDGQIQAPTGKPVSQISDGQIQAATNGTGVSTASATVAVYTGAAAAPTVRVELFGLAAGLLAIAAL